MLLELVDDLPVRPFEIKPSVDARGRYEFPLQRHFPFEIKVYSFAPIEGRYPLNWHERLELFIPVRGSGRFRMGDSVVEFSAGDVLVVDNLKLHGLVDFEGPPRIAINIFFTSDLIYSAATPLCDYEYLIPFYHQSVLAPVILRSDEECWPDVQLALERLVRCFFNLSGRKHVETGCKAYLLEVLHHLSKRFDSAGISWSEHLQQQEQAQAVGRIFEHLRQNYADRITVSEAASIVRMSPSCFMRFFKRASGMTFVAYLNHIRLRNAWRQLRETTLPVGEIAQRVGFSDPCYFNRKFKEYFQASPRQVRGE